MSNTLVLLFFGLSTIYFGGKTLRIAPTFFKLLKALISGSVKWPGPRIHSADHSSSVVRERLSVGYENLFSTFVFNALGGIGALGFSFLTFLSNTSMMRGYIQINWTFSAVLMTLFALAGGRWGFIKAQKLLDQVNQILSDTTKENEPRLVDSHSTRSEYAIEHPLIGNRNLSAESRRAIDQYYESVRHLQEGNEPRALSLYQQALQSDPSLHENACNTLLKLTHDQSSKEVGAIYYWIGIHSEYLHDLPQAVDAYKSAFNTFIKLDYLKRASRACNNLGSVKMQMRDPSAMDEFERAVELDPKNGIAHISIGVTYYRISERGDPRFEKALEAFANAIIADSLAYTPLVTARLQSIGYTWKEDLEDVLQRVDRKLLDINSDPKLSTANLPPKTNQKKGLGFDLGIPTGRLNPSKSTVKGKIGFSPDPPEKKLNKKTYEDMKHGFEIDIPKEWTIHKEIAPILVRELFEIAHGWTPDVDVAFTNGPDEILNIVIEIMEPEPTTNVTERFFQLYAQKMNFKNCEYGRIDVCNKAHTWVRYQMNDKVWSKKYMIVLSGKGYAITASCISKERFSQREDVWDTITTSFHLKE